MELEFKLSAIIGSCINEDQLSTARLCYLKAAETRKINIEQYHFLKKTADHKAKWLKDQMAAFELDRLAVDLHTDMGNEVDIFSTTDLPKTVAEAAEGLTVRKVA